MQKDNHDSDKDKGKKVPAIASFSGFKQRKSVSFRDRINRRLDITSPASWTDAQKLFAAERDSWRSISSQDNNNNNISSTSTSDLNVTSPVGSSHVPPPVVSQPAIAGPSLPTTNTGCQIIHFNRCALRPCYCEKFIFR